MWNVKKFLWQTGPSFPFLRWLSQEISFGAFWMLSQLKMRRVRLCCSCYPSKMSVNPMGGATATPREMVSCTPILSLHSPKRFSFVTHFIRWCLFDFNKIVCFLQILLMKAVGATHQTSPTFKKEGGLFFVTWATFSQREAKENSQMWGQLLSPKS